MDIIWDNGWASGTNIMARLPTHRKVYIGTVTNYFHKIGVAEIHLETQELSVGDEILIIGATTGAYEDTIDEMRVDLATVRTARKGDYLSIKTKDVVRRNDKVFRIMVSG